MPGAPGGGREIGEIGKVQAANSTVHARMVTEATARLGTGALPEAQQAYEHVLAEAELSEKLGMKPVQVASWWGNALFSQGHFAESIVPLKKALAEKPDLESESRTLENALLRIGDKDGAIAELERRLKVAPDDAAAREELERLRGGE